MRQVFIINPFAGKGNRQTDIIINLESRNIPYRLTTFAGEAQIIAREEAEKGDEVCIYSCGGEGTTYEIVNGIVGFPNASIGILPCGSANDFLKYFADSYAFSDIDNQLSGCEFLVDLIKVTSADKTYYSINSCSAGMDAMVCENAALFKKWRGVSGSMAYVFSVIYTLFQRFRSKIDFIIDGKEFKNIPSLFAVCANAPFYGGGYMCAPTANPSDGKLNYSIIATRSKLKTVLMLRKYRKGTHVGLSFCKCGECSEMEYHCETPVTFNIDGEVYRFQNVKCSVQSHALKLHLPKSIAQKFGDILPKVQKNDIVKA